MVVGNRFDQIPLSLKIGNQRLAAGVAVHALVLAGVLVHGGVVVHDLDLLKVVALTHEEVVGVVCGRDLDAARTKADLHVIVGDHGDLAANHGQDQRFADQVLHGLVLGVHGNGRVTKHGLGTRGGNLHVAVLPLDGVFDVPEMAGLILVFDLGVRQGGEATGAPVDDAMAAVDQALFIETDEDLAHGAGAALVKGEALTRPVAGCAELFELTRDAGLVLVLPLPDSLEEFLAAEIVAREALLHAQSFLDLDLGGDARVVGAGDPKGVVALHSLVAHEHVLERFVQRVTHVQLSRDVGGRNDHGEMLGVILHVGGKVALVAPLLVDSVLKLAGGVGFGQLVVLIHKEPPAYT